MEKNSTTGQQKLLFEDKQITNAEYRPTKKLHKTKSNEIIYYKTSAIEKRIQFNLHVEIQKRTFTLDKEAIEKEAEDIVNRKLIDNNLVDKETGKCLVSGSVRNIAIAEESRNIIKSRVNNTFEFSKKELLDITNTSPNNAYHLEKVLKGLIGKDTYKIIESYVTDDFSEIRQRKKNVSLIPVTGEDISLTNVNSEDKIIIKIEEDFIPYLIAPNKASKELSTGFNIIQGEIFESFDSEYAQILYKIIEDIKNIWQNKIYTYKEIQSLFGTKYGVIKKLDPKTGKPLKNKDNDFIYELDKEDNFIYADNYLDTWRFFKRDVLKKALIEINSDKTPYIVKIIEVRENRKKPLEGIKFQIDRKKDSSYNNLALYGSVYYYTVVQRQFERARGSEPLIEDMKVYAQAESFTKQLDTYRESGENFPTPINGAHNFNELFKRVENNVQAIKKIKSLLARNIEKISHLKFNEKYLVVVDSTSVNSGRLRLQKRLGNDAIECYDAIIDKYEDIINEDTNKNVKDLKNFINFKFKDKVSGDFININKSNLEDYRSRIEASIELGNKRDFKGFKAMSVKKEFYKIFFGE